MNSMDQEVVYQHSIMKYARAYFKKHRSDNPDHFDDVLKSAEEALAQFDELNVLIG